MSALATAAVESLFRIRAAETRDAEGLRRVWHQGSDVDLLSHVDPSGKLLRQELSLLGRHFLWTTEHGLQTGRVDASPGSRAVGASELVGLDDRIDEEKVVWAAAALGAYRGEDKYVLHIRQVLVFCARGLQDREAPIVTVSTDLPKLIGGQARARGVAWLVGAAATLLVAAAIILLLS